MNPYGTVQASEEVGVEGGEAILARGLPSPTQPTRKEIQKHVWTHLLPRSWCGHCLRETRTILPHLRSETEAEHALPTVSIDYYLMGPSGPEEAEGVLPMLAVKSHESRMTFAQVVERKGPQSTTRRLVADLDWLGLRRLVFESHQEPTVVALSMLCENHCPQLIL